jgi:hypothetical protein
MRDTSSIGAGAPAIYRPDVPGPGAGAPEVDDGELADRPSATGAGFAAQWRRSYGSCWWLDLVVLGVVVFLLGAMLPLEDADLPMHLATGEWIARHGGVPFTEPFAWTRSGAPYYAYSWALDLLYYAIMRAMGPVGLHILEGAILFAAAGAVVLLGRAAGWRPWTTLSIAALNVLAAILVVPALRPQLALFVLVPLAWAWAYRIVHAPKIRWAVVGMLLTCAAAANSHLFFVLTAAPIALLIAKPPAERRRLWALCAAIGAGWLLSPYGLNWPDVFRLNFGYNALLVKPSPIFEFRPGFGASTAMLLALPLTLLPWGIPRGRLTLREGLVHGALWLVGLLAFAYAGRLLLCWWLITLPLSGLVVEELGHQGASVPPRRRVRVATYAVVLLFSLVLASTMPAQWRNEGDAKSRRLPVVASEAIEPLLVWLECNTRPDATGRVYTWFNYGSYLAWRLPAYSASIDGRTIFPDSVAKPEMLVSGLLPEREYRAWSSADLAIIPLYFGVASTLDSSRAWARAASLHPRENAADSVGLWVKKSWWERTSTSELPEGGIVLAGPMTGSTEGACASAATIRRAKE